MSWVEIKPPGILSSLRTQTGPQSDTFSYVNVIAIAIAIIIVSTNIIFFVISDWLSDKVTFRAVLEPAKNDLALFHLQRLFSCTVLACCESCKKKRKRSRLLSFLSSLLPTFSGHQAPQSHAGSWVHIFTKKRENKPAMLWLQVAKSRI